MNTDFEKIISFVFASEEISPNDKLTRQFKVFKRMNFRRKI